MLDIELAGGFMQREILGEIVWWFLTLQLGAQSSS
jgi:hypothetical protein